VKWPVLIRPRAEADLREARQWYEEQRPGLGDEFLDEVRQAIILLEDQPTRRPPYYRDFRRVLTRRFPYKLFYRIERDCVIVFRVLHAKQDHRRWL
jgi:plasmid stabilization system protein ParE